MGSEVEAVDFAGELSLSYVGKVRNEGRGEHIFLTRDADHRSVPKWEDSQKLPVDRAVNSGSRLDWAHIRKLLLLSPCSM